MFGGSLYVYLLLGVQLFYPVVLTSCDYQSCADGCRRRHPSEDVFHTLDHCLQGCHSNRTGCIITTIATSPTKVKKDNYFKYPSRWIPTVLGCAVGVGVVCVVIYYARKSWRKRVRYAGYGFAKLRSKTQQTPETELAIVSL